MDLMKTLLIYITAMMALAVQSTAAPKETPIPTPAPDQTALVERTETPAPGEEEITPAPAEPTESTKEETAEPSPTITPNMRSYHNLGMGAKGKDVRKLQEKLIELRYLPEGSADAAYGRQTYNAVRKFQKYNGLKQDGVAGRATQTHLFEDPDVIVNPEATPAPSGTETPTDTPEVTREPETAEPETAVTDTPAPKAVEKATELPEATEEPEETEQPEATEEPESTEEPEATEESEVRDKPEVTEEPETTEDPNEIVENVDLDADIYEAIDGFVALNEGNGPLEFITTEDGVPVTAYPRLVQNGARIRVSLDDLCQCVENWRITDDGVGTVVLEVAGYTLALYSEDRGYSATVDGTEVSMKDDDFDFLTEGHFVNAEFLAGALKGEAVWDQEESTLMLRIPDKETAESTD